jgi:DNA-binding GntR family transcriptional regulator
VEILTGNTVTLSRKQLAYERLKNRILSLDLPPNTPLFEVDLANELGVSRTPVREALAALEREGLVQMIRGKGAFVTPVTEQRIIDSYEVREVLEGLAARLAAGRLAKEELEGLRDVFSACEQGTLSDVGQITGAADRLHFLIAERSGNGHLQNLLRQMNDDIKRVRSLSVQRSNRLVTSSREHIGIIDALLGGDCDQVEQLMKSHIRSVRIGIHDALSLKISR